MTHFRNYYEIAWEIWICTKSFFFPYTIGLNYTLGTSYLLCLELKLYAIIIVIFKDSSFSGWSGFPICCYSRTMSGFVRDVLNEIGSKVLKIKILNLIQGGKRLTILYTSIIVKFTNLKIVILLFIFI